MLKKSIAIFGISIILIMVSCSSGGAYGELRTVFSQQIGATEKLISDLENANDAKNVAAAYKSYNDVMEKVMPRYKEIIEKYPDMSEEEVPADLEAQADRLEEASNKLGNLSNRAAQYSDDPEVAKEMQRTMDIMMSWM
jgi:DNA repair ATPase RecN